MKKINWNKYRSQSGNCLRYWHALYHALLHPGVKIQHTFNFYRIDLESARVNHKLGSAAKNDLPVLVDISQIPRQKVSIFERKIIPNVSAEH